MYETWHSRPGRATAAFLYVTKRLPSQQLECWNMLTAAPTWMVMFDVSTCTSNLQRRDTATFGPTMWRSVQVQLPGTERGQKFSSDSCSIYLLKVLLLGIGTSSSSNICCKVQSTSDTDCLVFNRLYVKEFKYKLEQRELCTIYQPKHYYDNISTFTMSVAWMPNKHYIETCKCSAAKNTVEGL